MPKVTSQKQPQQQQPKVTPKPENAYPRKTLVVNREVCHLYSLQRLIVSDFIYIFYPVDLLTRLGHQYYTKLDWIQRTCHHIYVALNDQKEIPPILFGPLSTKYLSINAFVRSFHSTTHGNTSFQKHSSLLNGYSPTKFKILTT